MQNAPAWGQATYLTATGNTAITSANAQIIGILFHGTGTGTMQVFAGTTATVAANGAPLSGIIRAYATAAGATVNSPLYVPFPAYASGGITVNVGGSLDPKITLYWNPAGGA